MARSASSFYFDTSFMPEEEVKELAAQIAAIDPDWPDTQYLCDQDYKSLSLEESGVGYDGIQAMMYLYIDYVKEHYPEADVIGEAQYQQLNAEGTYKWLFDIKNGVATIDFTSAPMNYPSFCDCGEWLDFDIDSLTTKNYKRVKIKCPKCGAVISPYKDYEIEVFREVR